MKRGYFLGFSFIIVFSIGLGLTAFAEEGMIPAWIKNTSLWYGEGQVSDTEFINALQYLINQDVIKIPITEAVATTVNLEDKDRAMSFVVTFSQGDVFTTPLPIYTFYTFLHFSQTIGSNSVDLTQGLDKTPAFILQSLPSKDKELLYDVVNMYVNAGAKPVQFDVEVDVISGDGESIQTWEYRKCDVNDYATFTETNKEEYRFVDSNDMEIRELFVFACSGFSLK